jgi:hypothetical protein
MSVTLIEPEAPLPTGLDTYAVVLAWDGGHWDGSVPFAEGSVHLSPPRPPSTFDLEVLGLQGASVTWRGRALGVSPDDPQPSLVFAKVGDFSRFSMPSNVPDLAGSSASAMGPGQVLVIGGSSGTLIEQLAWIYDHPSASFLTSPPPSSALSHHLALPLLLTDPAGDTEWLLAGGEPDVTGVSATMHAEIYSRHYGGDAQPPLPIAQRVPVGSLVDPVGASAAVGCGVSADGDAGLLLFNPGSGFEPLPPFTGCGGGQVILIPDAGLAVLGFDGGAWLLPALDAGATFIGPLAVTHGFRTAVYNGALFVLGGAGTSGVTSDVERLFPDSASGQLTVARADFAVLPVDAGLLLIVGGRGADGGALASAELLDLSTLGPPAQFSMRTARIAPALSDIPGYGAALVVSGEDETCHPAGGFEVFTYP